MRKILRLLALPGLAALLGVGVGATVANAGGGLGPEEAVSCQSDLAAIRAVPQRVIAAWAANDADAFARVWAPDGDLIVGDGTYLADREEIYRYMRENYAGPGRGTRVTATVEDVRCLSATVGVMHTRGGILLPTETEVPPERRGIQTWVVNRHGSSWLVAAYQNTRSTAD